MSENMKIGILGGGIAGVSLASFLHPSNSICILEAEKNPGGLACSHEYKGFHYDVGPHIIFSKNKAVLDHMLKIGGDQLKAYERSNQIWYKGAYIKYPFENFLGLLNEREREYCLSNFLDNPYSEYSASNMLQFFLKIFGEGITNTYLRPYNQKIWKYDPSFLDLQMVGRIPKPPNQDIIDGANGNYKEGYTHQSQFYYPKQGGIQAFFNEAFKKLPDNVKVLPAQKIIKIEQKNKGWAVKSQSQQTWNFDRIFNCMPLANLFSTFDFPVPETVQKSLQGLKYNSMYYGVIIFSKDFAGNNFSINIPSSDIIFHRISKLNFLEEHENSGFLFEITYRANSNLASLSKDEIREKILDGFEMMKLAYRKDFLDFDLKSVEKSYVIYDIDHRKNTDSVLEYLAALDIFCCGRFAEHEYLNMDHVIERAMKLAEKINKS